VVRDSSLAPVGVVLCSFVAWVSAPRRSRDVNGLLMKFAGGEEDVVEVEREAEVEVEVSAGEADSS